MSSLKTVGNVEAITLDVDVAKKDKRSCSKNSITMTIK
jgi:hypothetical protein